MRINSEPPDEVFLRSSLRDLAELAGQPSDRAKRPCADCRVPCPCSKSISCSCNCSPECPHAPCMMSTEPETHPIEPGIVPLVYALRCLRLVRPCWSCEGHNDAGGRLHKKPRVWFHAGSMLYPALIGGRLADLRIAKRLTTPWDVRVVVWGDKLQPAFSIEPDVCAAEQPDLRDLRADIGIIAQDLQEQLKALARQRIELVETALAADLR